MLCTSSGRLRSEGAIERRGIRGEEKPPLEYIDLKEVECNA